MLVVCLDGGILKLLNILLVSLSFEKCTKYLQIFLTLFKNTVFRVTLLIMIILR